MGKNLISYFCSQVCKEENKTDCSVLEIQGGYCPAFHFAEYLANQLSEDILIKPQFTSVKEINLDLKFKGQLKPKLFLNED